jgi:hypothetical protein
MLTFLSPVDPITRIRGEEGDAIIAEAEMNGGKPKSVLRTVVRCLIVSVKASCQKMSAPYRNLSPDYFFLRPHRLVVLQRILWVDIYRLLLFRYDDRHNSR